MNRTSIIQFLIDNYSLKSYLEIGVRTGTTFLKLKNLQLKVGVDPDKKSKATTFKTSDDYFKNLDINVKFDIIFIDGYHEDSQVEKDIENSLKHLNKGGFIVCHDMNPIKKEHQLEMKWYNKIHPQYGLIKTLNGNCWKTWAKLRYTNKNIKMHVVDCDHGCGIIQIDKQELIEKIDLTYENLEKDRKNILNLISPNEFIEIFKK